VASARNTFAFLFLFSAAFLTMIPKQWRGAFLVSFFGSKKVRFFLFFSFSHASRQEEVMYEHAPFPFLSLHRRLEKSGWMDGWKGKAGGSLDQFGEQIKGTL